jgi:hypothetical protein
MEVFSPGTKNMQNYILNRILVYVYREFRAREKPGIIPQIRADELPIQPPITEAIVRKRLKHCADLRVKIYHSCYYYSCSSFCFSGALTFDVGCLV